MSLMTMRKKMSSKKTITMIIWVLIIVFLAGVALWSVPKGVTGGSQTKFSGTGADQVVLTVNGDPVTFGEVMDVVQDTEKNSHATTLDAISQTHAQALDQVIMKKLTDKALSASKLEVDDEYLHNWATDDVLMQTDMLRQQTVQDYAQQLKSAKPDELKKLKKPEQTLRETLAEFMRKHAGSDVTTPNEVSPETFQNWYVDDYAVNSDNKDNFLDRAKITLLGMKILKSLKPVDPLSEAYVRKLNSQEVRGRFIFVPATANTAGALQIAQDQTNEAYSQVLKTPKDFAQIAKKYSKDSSASSGGDLHWVKGNSPGIASMTEYLLFALQPGEMSKPVQITAQSPYGGDTQVGYGFVLVDQVRDRAPDDLKDFNWNRDKKMLMLKTRLQYSGALGDAYLHFLRANATIVSKRHEMQAYLDDLAKDTLKANQEREASLAPTGDANLPADVRASFSYSLGNAVLGNDTPSLQKRIDDYSAALPYAGSQVPQLHMKLGDAYMALRENDTKLQDADKNQHDKLQDADKIQRDSQNAKEQYYDALADAKITADYASITQIQQAYQTLNYTEGVADITKWLKENPKPAQSSPSMSNGQGGMTLPAGN